MAPGATLRSSMWFLNKRCREQKGQGVGPNWALNESKVSLWVEPWLQQPFSAMNRLEEHFLVRLSQ